ncbi:hypothetical protein EON80_16415 [bacterium]|nr:MAG: hypothetical protein EON80_16415 [bacterium]
MKRSTVSLTLLCVTLVAGFLLVNTSSSARTPTSNDKLDLSSKIGLTCNVRSRSGDGKDSSFGKLIAVNDKWLVLEDPNAPNSNPLIVTSPNGTKSTLLKTQTWIPADMVTSVQFIEEK